MKRVKVHKWSNESNREKGDKVICFLISPVLGLIASLHKINTKSSFVIYYLFAIIFGISFTVGNVRTEGSIDGISYRIDFENVVNHSTHGTLGDSVKEYFTFDSDQKDIYTNIVNYLVSRITSNYHILFMVFALVFAFFQVKTNKFLVEYSSNSKPLLFLIVLLLVFNQNDIFNINGVRFWTATWVSLYAFFKITVSNDWRYNFLLLLTPLIHGAFFVVYAFIALHYLTKNYDYVWIVLFALSFFVSAASIEASGELPSFLPPAIQRLIKTYTDPDYIESRRAWGTGYFYVMWYFQLAERFFYSLLTILLIINLRQIKQDEALRKVFHLMLIIMTFANFTMGIPSVGKRFMYLGVPLIGYLWIRLSSVNKYNDVMYATPVVLLYSLYAKVKLYISVLPSEFLFASPVYLFVKYFLQ